MNINLLGRKAKPGWQREERMREQTKEQIVYWGVIILGITLVFAIPAGVSYYECGQVCTAKQHQRFWTLTQGCYCLDDDGKPYNPRDER